MRSVLPFLALLAVATPAPAQTVDDAGAGRIVESLARYIGSTVFDKGIVKVSVDGDAYELLMDFQALAAMAPESNALSLDLAPVVLRLKPLPDGTLSVSGGLLPEGSIGFQTPETELSPSMRSQFEWTLQESALTGIFAPELGMFSSAAGAFRGMKSVSSDDRQRAEISIGAGTFEMTAVKSAGEGVDYDATQTMVDLVETLTMPTAPDGPAVPIGLTAPKITVVSGATGLQLKPILDIVAFGVARADKDEIAAEDQAELKRLTLAALPLWGTITGGYDVTGLMVETPVGEFRFDSVATDITIDGISESGSLDYDFDIGGIAIPAHLVPDWGTPLLPTDVSLNFGLRNLNSESPVRQFIEAADLLGDQPLPEETGQKILAEFLANPPIVVMEQSVIRNADIEITMSGKMPISLGSPEMRATIEMEGFETAASALQAAAAVDPTAQEALPFVLAAKGLGKMLEDGRLQWIVDLRSDGALLVNGAMLKGPDPIEVPLPEQ